MGTEYIVQDTEREGRSVSDRENVMIEHIADFSPLADC